MSVQFNSKAADSAAVATLQAELGLPHFIATTLVARGIDTPEAAKRFLTPSLDRDWLDPYIIPGLSAVADALQEVMKAKGHIVVFGDFDLDGISATAVLTRGLQALGAWVTPFIPRRFEEGYALTAAAFERLLLLKPDYIVTVDCGISCKTEAAAVVAAGVGLAITDHHEPGELMPEGVPVADPKCDPNCKSSILAGVGVALKLVQVLGGRFGQPHRWRDYTDLATLGTVADLMPMRDENRALVAEGIARMNNNPRPCIAALLASSGSADKPVSSTNLSFSIIPRLNAAGRMGDARLALDVLLSDSFDEATRLSGELERVNDQRRAIEAELSQVAKAQAAKVYHGQRALVVSGENWHEGVKGIVASRLVNIYGVPSLLFTIDGDEARGSGRSVGQINLFKAVESASDLLTRFGGHEAAVGLTLPASQLPAFEKRLCAYMDTLPERAFHPLIKIDACVHLDELTLESVAQLDRLAPFGQEHNVPVYLARDVSLANVRSVGAEKNHFSCTLTNGAAKVAGIMFHCSDIDTLMHTDSVVNAAFQVQIDEWRGRRSVKAMLQSLAPAHACGGLEACLNPENLSFVADLYATSDAELCAATPVDPAEIQTYEAELEKNRARWEYEAATDPAGLEQALVSAIIGQRPLHRAQREILDNLKENRSVLGVMVTGRGKSLTFEVHAAMRALAQGQASLFVYPLRALVADQAFHLCESLDAFGVRTVILTGESAPEERRAVFEGLGAGAFDIVLTTPEFLSWHAEEFAASKRVAFVVIDEAHHMGLAKAGQRQAYATLGKTIAQLGQPKPVLLALTATAGDEEEAVIKDELSIDINVFDVSGRPNLVLDDKRNLRNKDDYIAHLIASGEKTVIYVNAREHSVALARALRKRVPQAAPLIGFYNAGLSRFERKRIEELFRSDALSVLVATSAFGEGVDIPNIRHVVLYHVPFNAIECNQMSGRAGRDGEPAWVHLLFGRADCAINEGILRDRTPDHDCFAQIYRCLRTLQQASAEEFFTISNVDLARTASTEAFPVCAASASCAVSVFRELGLIETHAAFGLDGMARSIHVKQTTGKVELSDSVRYREGLDEREMFRRFRDWAMKSDAKTFHARIAFPILPQRVCADQRGDRQGGKEVAQ